MQDALQQQSQLSYAHALAFREMMKRVFDNPPLGYQKRRAQVLAQLKAERAEAEALMAAPLPAVKQEEGPVKRRQNSGRDSKSEANRKLAGKASARHLHLHVASMAA
jgi:hypothetical protein